MSIFSKKRWIGLGERSAALQLEAQAELLESPEPMPDPIVLLDETGIDQQVARLDFDQVQEVGL